MFNVFLYSGLPPGFGLEMVAFVRARPRQP
jgi:hypothetical protein